MHLVPEGTPSLLIQPLQSVKMLCLITFPRELFPSPFLLSSNHSYEGRCGLELDCIFNQKLIEC